jgi:hypothetical protein
MTAAKCPDDEFIELVENKGPAETARILKCGIRAIYKRRENIERRTGRQIVATKETGGGRRTRFKINHSERADLFIDNGVVIVGSDAHYFPGIISTAHLGLVKFCKMLKPTAVIMNGDILDGAKVSRHPSMGWEDKPSIAQEIKAANERLGEIQTAAKGAKLFWTLGNHDARLESRIANVAPELAKLHGVHLKDHFDPAWEPCWSVWINGSSDEPVVVKHRHKNGIHATHNSTMWAGTTMVTGHLHSLKVTPFTDYRGTRYGVDTGTLADIYGPQFDYCEDNPRSWRSGFVVLTFADGKLLWPEVVHALEPGRVEFRGRVYEV